MNTEQNAPASHACYGRRIYRLPSGIAGDDPGIRIIALVSQRSYAIKSYRIRVGSVPARSFCIQLPTAIPMFAGNESHFYVSGYLLATSESAAILRHDAGRTAWSKPIYCDAPCLPTPNPHIFIKPGRAEDYSDFAEATRSQRAICQLYSPSRYEPGSISRAPCCNGIRVHQRPQRYRTMQAYDGTMSCYL